jgi:hypothetical protein
MATTILIKRSTTSGEVPTTSDLAVGELAINTADKRIFTNNSGTIVELGTTPSTQAVTGNATVGGTFSVVGAVSVDDFTATGTVNLTGATTTVATPTADSHAATKLYVDTAVNDILDGAPAALDTLNEIAAAINDDANVYTTLTNSIATKLPLAGGTMTGSIDMGANKVTSTATPTADSDLTRKAYVDDLYQSTVDAETSAANALASEQAAATSASNASGSASTAATQASNASSSATAAASSATAASNSATSASNSATTATTQATNAASSATAASDSADDAEASATAAAGSATAAAQSATDAANALDTKVSKSGDTMTGDLDVQGTVTADGLTVDGTALIENGNVLRIERPDGATNSDIYMQAGGQGGLTFLNNNNDGFEFKFATGGDKLTIANNGDISFYEDTGTTPKFFWDASAERLGIGTSSPSATVDLVIPSPAASASTAGLEMTEGAKVFALNSTGSSYSYAGVGANELWYYSNGNFGALTFGSDGAVPIKFISNGSERLRIDSSGNVGIGTSSPDSPLDVVAPLTNSVYASFSSTDTRPLQLSSFNTTSVDAGHDFNASSGNGALSFSTGSSERMRIDSSGNLLVGQTTPSTGSNGVYLRSNSDSGFNVTNGNVISLNRLSSDGSIAQFRKDGTTVGSIGSVIDTDTSTNSELYFTSGNTGLMFDDTSNFIRPCNSSGAARDNIVDLGEGDNRFKDLYLSGGVYLGGTGSANHLDDYEEGGWTPVVADATSGGNTASTTASAGNYTKIGRVVVLNCYLLNVNTSGMTGSNDMVIRGMPFATSGNIHLGSVMIDNINYDGFVTVLTSGGTSHLTLKNNRDSNSDNTIVVNDLTSGVTDIFFTITYQTNV